MKVRQLYNYLLENLKNVSDEADAEARFIIEELLGKKFEFLFISEECISSVLQSKIEEILEKRVKERVPLQYIFQKAYFYGFELYVDERVFIPRGDTEVIIDYVIKNFKGQHLRWVDVCTGSGAIAVALGKYLGGIGFASDISYDSILVAMQNISRYQLEVRCVVSDMLSCFKGNSLNLIVANPPYIGLWEKSSLSEEVLKEPWRALFGGEKGFEVTERLLEEAMRVLVPGGDIIIETSESCNGYLKRRFMDDYFYLKSEIFDLRGQLRGLHFSKNH